VPDETISIRRALFGRGRGHIRYCRNAPPSRSGLLEKSAGIRNLPDRLFSLGACCMTSAVIIFLFSLHFLSIDDGTPVEKKA
jgi:hypothetical protein